MSSISFTSPTGRIRISGRERGMMGVICNDFRRMQTGDFGHGDLTWLRHVARPGHYLHTGAIKIMEAAGDAARNAEQRRLASDLDTYLNVGFGDAALFLDGQPVDTFTLALNSGLSWGNRAVALAAKLHGQCEIHAYCEGGDRAWLADVVQEAIDCGVFRPDAWGYDGWPKLVDFLRASDDEPVVTSYSVTDDFPNAGLVPDGAIPRDTDGEIDWEAWDEIDPAQKWKWGMSAIRSEPELRISPDSLGRSFGDGLTGSGFMARVRSLNIDDLVKETGTD